MPVKTYFGPVQDIEKQIARCSRCEEWKPFSEFSPERPGKKRLVQSHCKKCACEEWRLRKSKTNNNESWKEVSDTKKCDHCGITKPITEMVSKSKKSVTPGVLPLCKDCLNVKKRAMYQRSKTSVQKLWKTRDQTPKCRAKRLYNGVQSRCKESGIELGLTTEWFEKKCEAGVCEVSGVKFDFSRANTRVNPFSPSIDRIDPGIGYTEENCKMVLWTYNLAKNNFTHEDVMKMARALVKKEQEMMFTPPDMV